MALVAVPCRFPPLDGVTGHESFRAYFSILCGFTALGFIENHRKNESSFLKSSIDGVTGHESFRAYFSILCGFTTLGFIENV